MGDTQSSEENPGLGSQYGPVKAKSRYHSPVNHGLLNGNVLNPNQTLDSGGESDTQNCSVSSGTTPRQQYNKSQLTQRRTDTDKRFLAQTVGYVTGPQYHFGSPGSVDDLRSSQSQIGAKRSYVKPTRRSRNVDDLRSTFTEGTNGHLRYQRNVYTGTGIVSNRMDAQRLQMFAFSASVPEISNENRSQPISQQHLRTTTSQRDRNILNISSRIIQRPVGHMSTAQMSSVPVHNKPTQFTKMSSPSNEKSLDQEQMHSQRTPSPLSAPNNFLFVKKQSNSSPLELHGSQHVLSTNRQPLDKPVNVMKHQENPGHSRPNDIQLEMSELPSYRPPVMIQKVSEPSTNILHEDLMTSDCVKQLEEMQYALKQLELNSKQILQGMDNEERENKEWSSVISKKAAGIETRLKTLEDKAKEDERMLIQLIDLTNTMSDKFSHLENQVKTMTGHVEAEVHTSYEVLQSEIDRKAKGQTCEESEERLVHCNTLPLKTDTETNKVATAELGTENDFSKQGERSKNLSLLPNIAKDHKGYKDRCTERKIDNRRKLRREKRKNISKRKSQHGSEQESGETVVVSPSLNVEAGTSLPSQDNAPQDHSNHHNISPSNPFIRALQQRVRRQSIDSTGSYDSKDDYRNLAVLATGDRVLPTVQQEVIPDVEQFWNTLRETEVTTARSLRPQKDTGQETYLILDTSASMEGQPFTDMITTATEFINGMCDNSLITDENLCIMQVGEDTGVLVHLTNDRQKLLTSLGKLKPSGMSPITGSFLILMGLLTKKNSNIVVISDGMMTPLHIRHGQDLPEIDNYELKRQTSLAGEYFESVNCKVYFVPVGTYDSSLMGMVVKQTGGKKVEPRNISRIYNFSKNISVVSQLLQDFQHNVLEKRMRKDQLTEYLESSVQSLDIHPEDLTEILDKIKEHKKDDVKYIECDPNMPPLGTRVRRGPDWMFDNQDLGMAGTVISHTDHGQIWIEWDHGDHNIYRYGADRCYDVVTTDDPRCLVDGQNVAVGCVVRRGIDWNHSNNDDGGQGKTGAVYFVKNNGSLIKVRWSNGVIGQYKFGEVELCDPNEHILQEHMPPSGGEPETGPNILLEKSEPEIDPIVAEMNKKNALMSGQPLKAAASHSISDEDKSFPEKSDTLAETPYFLSESNKTEAENPISSNRINVDKSSKDSTSNQGVKKGVQGGIKADQSFKDSTRKSEPKEAGKSGMSADRSTKDLAIQTKESSKGGNGNGSVIDIPRKGQGIWQYKDGYGGWKPYPKEHNDKLEKGYCHHPKGASVLAIGKSTYRILFTKMKQVNAKTKEMIDIRRVLPSS